MKICISLVLLTLLCPGGCPVYDFDLRTVEQPSQFANGLKLAADLNSEYNQGIMNFHVLHDQGGISDDNTCKLNAMTLADNEEYPPRKLQFSRKIADEETTDLELEDFVGSNLFDSTRKKCFSPEDLNLLSARRDFEYLVPKDLPKCLLNDDMLNMLLNYFYTGNELIQRMPESTKKFLERAYYDMLGGYLHSYFLPAAKYSYYGGKASLKVVSSVVELYQQCKTFLNTNGKGWKMPISLEEMNNVHVEPLRGSDCGADVSNAGGSSGGSGPTGCARLEMLPTNDGDENIMLVAMPKLEADCIDNNLGNIWLPFRKRRNYDLRSPKSAYVIMRFYAAVTRCYQSQSVPQDTFNSKFINWINEYIKPHLSDVEFYPGLGGVLRIVEKLRKGRKALDYDNYDDDDHAAPIVERRRMDVFSVDNNAMGKDAESRSEDGFSDMDLARKALEYKMHEQEKKTMINSKRWFERISNDNNMNNFNNKNNKNNIINTSNNISDRQLQSRKICDKSKAQQKSTQIVQQQKQPATNHIKSTKAKCKPKGGKHGGKGGGSMFKLTTEQQKHYLKYLCYIIGVILLILLIILLVAMLMRYRKRKRPESRQRPPKRKRKCPGWCNLLLCRKKPADEEINIRPDSKSVIATQPHRRVSTSTSSLVCQPAAKCIPCSKRATKESESAPIIETTSLDYYSSSEPDSKVRQKSKKAKPKVVTIDEKKKKTIVSLSPTKSKQKPMPTKSRSNSPKKSGRIGGGADQPTSTSSSDSNKRLGIQRTINPIDNKKSSSETDTKEEVHKERSVSRERSKGSRSWETMYDT
ncbi:uncharacterized protein [Eurosta solidaginis]|uniref:uncharacterized protein n=1 Tax=Eurosta solidaginis TaxID=178769 RepID=UPI003530F15F